jgi:hypothetical protein
MGTRSRIGIQLSDDSILSVYHHWDGYPTWLGRILKTHYNTKEKVSELIDGGDMSCAWTKERWTGKELAPYVKEIKEEEEYGPQYYAQRGDDCPPHLDNNVAEYLSDGEEYAYIFTPTGEWVCYDMNQFDHRKKPEIVEISNTPLHV